MIKSKQLLLRIIIYICGLFIMTIGISISVKSDLGVAPVSSVPYAVTYVFGMEMGNATILFHILLVILQVVLLRKKFKSQSILQIAVGIMFGKFTTFCNTVMTFLPTPENIVIRLFMIVISTALIATGIFFYMPANIMPLAPEGAMQALSDVFKIKLSKIKIYFDVTLVLIALILCIVFTGNVGSVGPGTVMAAFLVGFILGILTKKFATKRYELLGI